jgi:hypothetical protein
VARVDITPDYAVRLSGFGFRREESSGVTQRIWAKALAIGSAPQPATVLVTVDNLGIPAAMVAEVAKRLGLAAERLVVAATHTHTAPMLRGVAPTLFGEPIAAEHQARIDRYTRELTDRLEAVARAALAAREPATLAWGVGRVGFARNRRTEGGPVDHDLPFLVVRHAGGRVRALHTTYACHCVTLSHNEISGDWAGFAQEALERDHPDAIALVSVGCGADANPSSGVTGNKVEAARKQGEEIALEVRRLLAGTDLAPLPGRIAATRVEIELGLEGPRSRQEWERRAGQGGAVAYHARVNLERLERGEPLPASIEYPVTTWRFGEGLAMVFLAGEVVVDYSLRLKRELDRRRLWVVAYANDAPCYIPSRRILEEGGYEAEGAMVYYDLPHRFRPAVETQIVAAVRAGVGERFEATPGAPPPPEDP